MNRILESIRAVIKDSKQVRINEDSLKKVCNDFNCNDIDHQGDSFPFDPSYLSKEDKANFVFFFNSINFCYWGEPKWAIEYQGKEYDGAWGMIVSIKRALDNKIPVLDADYLSNISREDLLNILKGNTIIPLFNERLGILRENGRILSEKYNGQFMEVINRADGNALDVLNIMVSDFPSYNDHAVYDNQNVLFHKRAQLAVSDIHRMKGIDDLKDIEKLTAFADYKIPQSLRKLGILEYSPELSEKIDNKIEIPSGSREEIEIRANMIWAIELMKGELATKKPDITSMDIDYWLWLSGQNKSPDNKPYHRTRTIYY